MRLTTIHKVFYNKLLCNWKNINRFTALNLKFNLT
jgi:hypothetical protein